MPRISRQYSTTKVYHVIVRGIDKQDIFLDDKDKDKFLEFLRETKEKYTFEVYSYCLMDNHVHIVIYDKENQLSKLMQSLEIRYSIYFNKRYNRIGHLFQNRYFSRKIEDRDYLMQVCRYIHRNPLKAGIQQTEKYKWSSFQEYIKKAKIINPKILLSCFSEEQNKAIEGFLAFHNINSNNEIYEELEFEMKDKLTDEQLNRYICELLKIDEVHQITELNVEQRNKILIKIKERKEITSVQLARVLGINRKIVERAK